MRVVVTGLGLISPLGIGVEAHRSGWLEGRSAVGPLSALDPGPIPVDAAGQVSGFKARDYIENRKNLKLMTRAVRLGLSAAHLAVVDAGLDGREVEPRRFGIYVGAPHAFGESRDLIPALEASTANDEFDLVAFAEHGLPRVHPLWLLKGLSNNVLGFSSQRYGAMGPNANYSGSGAGAAQAIGEGCRSILDGRADVILCGGYDSMLTLEALTGYARLGMLATPGGDPHRASRPFDRDRGGFVPSEGGAFVVLEREDRVLARGGNAYAALVGVGEACDAFDPASPQPQGRGLRLASSKALGMAEADLGSLGCVVAHASGSVAFDSVECLALQHLLAEQLERVPVTAPKGSIGHTIAASGAFGVAAAALALDSGRVGPTANLDTADPRCNVRHVQTGGEDLAGPLALVQSAGLGGLCCSLVLSRRD